MSMRFVFCSDLGTDRPRIKVLIGILGGLEEVGRMEKQGDGLQRGCWIRGFFPKYACLTCDFNILRFED